MTEDVLLQVENLRIEARTGNASSEIVKGVSLELRRGEVLGLIGESGAGKSTLGLAAMGFVRDGCSISAGTVRFKGADLLAMAEKERRRLRGRHFAYVAQSAAAAFNPAYTLLAQFAELPRRFALGSRPEIERNAVALYRKMRLPDPDRIGLRYPHQVSGGQLQRAMTAMAMACRPALIVFDEPTTALDVTTQIEVLSTIREVVREHHAAALYITHDLAVVAQMADRIKVMRYGHEIEEAETRRMLSDPREDYTKALWAVNRFRKSTRAVPGRETAPVLSIDRVSAGYGRQPVLHGISLEIHKGRTLAVVGESGSGKSTAARCVTGLLLPDSGEIRFNGARLQPDYRKRSQNELRQIQMIYQMADTALNPRKRIGDILGRPAHRYLGLKGRRRAERVRELLRMIELEPDEMIDRFPASLSGGQKQRVGIARALAAEPELIICDEVTSALDQIVAEGVLRLLDRLQGELGLSFMFITHNIETVRAIADDVVVMQQGRIVEAGRKDRVLDTPAQPYTRELLASVPAMDADWLDKTLAGRN